MTALDLDRQGDLFGTGPAGRYDPTVAGYPPQSDPSYDPRAGGHWLFLKDLDA